MNFRFRYLSLLILLCYTFSSAEIRYVSKTGSSTPPFNSWETAADSIQKCINISFNGDTIVVANGVYKEALVIDSSLTLIGSSMDSCIIDGSGMGFGWLVRVNNNITVEGFNFIGRGKANVLQNLYSLLFVLYPYYAEISSCRFSNSSFGIGIYGGFLKDLVITDVWRGVETFCFEESCNPRMENSVIFLSPQSYSYEKIAWNNSDGGNPVLIGNIFLAMPDNRKTYGMHSIFSPIKRLVAVNNLFAGFNMQCIVGWVRPDLGDSAFIINNIIRDFRKYENNRAAIQSTTKTTVMYNNIISNSDVGVHFYEKPAKSDYNLYWNNGVNFTGVNGLGANDIFSDPMFVKDTIAHSLQYDYHLQEFSPAIDAGDPYVFDLDGTRSDIGMYGGPLGMSYKYENLPPQPPKNFTVTLDTLPKIVLMKWSKNTEADFYRYEIYRSGVSGFIPDSSSRVAVTDSSSFTDTLLENQERVYYRVIAFDSSFNASVPGPEISVVITGTDDSEIKIVEDYQLYQNYPNPFNGMTTIPYSLKERGRVKLMVYDIKGELITELINREEEKGYHEISFDAGKLNLSSGMYLYRIEVIGEGMIPKFMKMWKMVYMK
jgi:hypothetical protein